VAVSRRLTATGSRLPAACALVPAAMFLDMASWVWESPVPSQQCEPDALNLCPFEAGAPRSTKQARAAASYARSAGVWSLTARGSHVADAMVPHKEVPAVPAHVRCARGARHHRGTRRRQARERCSKCLHLHYGLSKIFSSAHCVNLVV